MIKWGFKFIIGSFDKITSLFMKISNKEKWLLIGLGAVLLLVFARLATVLRFAPVDEEMVSISAGADSFGQGELYYPRGVAVGPAGDIYVVDSGNCAVRVYSPLGKQLRSWGKCGTDPGQFKEPGGIAVGGDGTVVVADTWNHRVQLFDRDGKLLNEWSVPDGMFGPRDVAIDGFGHIYVADTGKHRVLKFDKDGKLIRSLGGDKSKKVGFFNEPFGLTVNGENELYVADRLNYRLQIFSRQGTYRRGIKIKAWAEEQYLMEPDISVDNERRLVYVSDPFAARLLKYDWLGELIGEYKEDDQGHSLFTKPVGVAVGQDGRVYVSDVLEHRIVVLDTMNGK